MRPLRVVLALSIAAVGLVTPATAAGLHDIVYLGRPNFIAVEGKAGVVDVKRCCHSFADASVRVSSSSGSAEPGVDYNEISGTIRFDEPVDSGRAQVSTIADSVQEGLETVGIGLSEVNGGASIAYPSAGVLTIVDDDGPARVSLSTPTLQTFENRASFELVLIRSGAAATPGSVTFTTSDGTATAGDDYDEATGTVEWGEGERVKSVTIAQHDDTMEECDESLTLSLSDPQGLELADPSATEVTIHDDECPASDTSSPFTAFHQPLNDRTYRSGDLQDVLVFADDADGSGMKRIAIAFMKKLRSGKCMWLDKKARKFVPAGCEEQHWMRFPGRDLLAYPLPERLERSTGRRAPVRFYKAWSRGTDVVGNVETAFDLNRNVSIFEVR
ncbi:MAG: hypothetical protein QOG54_695 [Actinomycetota bacterium]|jgi:hypothetical protein|nr:hypothetical protein [Actinomycetota bacterium]